MVTYSLLRLTGSLTGAVISLVETAVERIIMPMVCILTTLKFHLQIFYAFTHLKMNYLFLESGY